MNRRAFLGFAGAVGAALVIPVRWASAQAQASTGLPPRLYGDGVHDDTSALQWYIDHAVAVPEGEYTIRKTLRVSPSGHFIMSHSRVTAAPGLEPWVEIAPEGRYHLWGNTFVGAQAKGPR